MEHMQKDYLRVNQLRTISTQSVATFAFPAFAAPALCWLLWDISDRGHLLTWTGVIIIYSLLRYLLIWKQRHQVISPENAGKWLDIFTISVLISGVLWGLAAILLIPFRLNALMEFTFYNSLTILVICGLVAGAVVSYAVSKQILFSFAFPALVPPAFYLISLGDKYNSALGGFILLYMIFITISSFRLNRQFLYYLDMEQKLIELHHESERLNALVKKLKSSGSDQVV